MAKENFSLEDKRNLSLEIVKILSDRPMTGADLTRELENSNTVNKRLVNYSYLTTYFLPKILEEKILGSIRKNKKFFVDDYETARDMINDFFSRAEKSSKARKEVNKRDVNTWNNIKVLVQIIKSIPGITTGELRDRFKKSTGKSLSVEMIDKYNEILTLNNMAIDFYERTSRGERMRLSNPNSVKIIDKIIESLNPKIRKDLKEKMKENRKSENEVNRLSSQEMEDTKINIINILYLSSGMTLSELEISYTDRYKKRMSSNALRLILNSMLELGGVNYEKGTGRYYIDNYSELIAKINPRKLSLNLVIKVNSKDEFPHLNGLGNGTKQLIESFGSVNLWEITGYNSKELTESLVLNSALGKLQVISPTHIKGRINEIITEKLAKLNEII